MSATLPSPPYWRVLLTGHQFDLEEMRDALQSPDLRIVTDGDFAYLVSTEFERLNDSALILEYAKQVRDLMNGAGAALIGGFGGTDIGPVQYVSENGKVITHATVTASAVSLRARPSIAGVVATAAVPVERELAEPLLAKALRIARDDEDLAHVLQLLNNPSWVNLYIVHEIMRRVLEPNYLSTVGTNPNELRRFKHSANVIARHDPEKFDPPQKPMTHDEAKSYIQRHVMAWVHSLPGSHRADLVK